jgi:hypothetical protein
MTVVTVSGGALAGGLWARECPTAIGGGDVSVGGAVRAAVAAGRPEQAVSMLRTRMMEKAAGLLFVTMNSL